MATGEPTHSGEIQRSNKEILSTIESSSSDDRFTERLRRRNLAINLHRAFKGRICDTAEWLSDIIPNVRYSSCDELVKRAESALCANKEKAIAIVYHPENKEGTKGHIHLYHTCGYINSYCRCSFHKGFNIKRRRVRTHSTVCQLNQEYFNNWLKYYTTKPRQVLYFQIGTVSYRQQICEIGDLRSSFHIDGDETNRDVETSIFSCESIGRERGQQKETYDRNTECNKNVTRLVGEGYSNLSGNDFKPSLQVKKRVDLSNQLVSQIMRILAIPIEAACSTNPWLQDTYLSYFDKKNSDYQLACSTINRMISSLTFDQLYEIHTTKGCLQIYNNRSGDHYYNLEDSIKVCEKLLLHQYETEENVKLFLQKLYNICEKIIPKKNTLFIQGE